MTSHMQFPDTTNNPRSADGTEVILGGSVLINRILAMFKDRSLTDRKAEWDLYLLNAWTIVRNVYVPGMKPAQIREAFLKDCELFCTYLEAYLSCFRWAQGTRIPIVVYFPDYKKLPEDIARVPKGQNEDIFKAYLNLRKEMPSANMLLSQSMLTDRWIVHAGGGSLPHVELAAWVKNFSLGNHTSSYAWGKKVFLMTHCPVDLHIHRLIPEINLIESFTAAIKTPKEFGSKLIKDVPIPFNYATHRAFGDSLQIHPIAQRQVRASLIEVAKERKWMTRTLETIVNDIVKVTGVTAAELNRVKF